MRLIRTSTSFRPRFTQDVPEAEAERPRALGTALDPEQEHAAVSGAGEDLAAPRPGTLVHASAMCQRDGTVGREVRVVAHPLPAAATKIAGGWNFGAAQPVE
jgi:hypothetical protein